MITLDGQNVDSTQHFIQFKTSIRLASSSAVRLTINVPFTGMPEQLA